MIDFAKDSVLLLSMRYEVGSYWIGSSEKAILSLYLRYNSRHTSLFLILTNIPLKSVGRKALG